MKEDHFRFLPRHDLNDGTWVIQNPQNSDPTLDATVRHVHVRQMDNEDLKEELHEAQRTAQHVQKENDALRAQLGLPPLYEKKPRSLPSSTPPLRVMMPLCNKNVVSLRVESSHCVSCETLFA